MLSFIIRRVLLAIPVLIGIMIVVFVLVRAIPGDPCTSLLGERATEEACDVFNEANGLNEPVWVQLGIYMGNVVTFDLGESIRFSRPVNQLLIERLPLTTELALSALALAVLVGIPLGVVAARKHNTVVDTGTMALANVGVSMPVFWLGLMLAYVFALILKDTPFALPPSGRISAGLSSTPYFEVWGWELTEGSTWAKVNEYVGNHYIFNNLITGQWEVFWDAVKHMILPAVALATIPLDNRSYHSQCASRGHGQRLHPHCSRQRGQGMVRGPEPCVPQRAVAGGYHRRSSTRSAPRRCRAHRNGVQSRRCWPSSL